MKQPISTFSNIFYPGLMWWTLFTAQQPSHPIFFWWLIAMSLMMGVSSGAFHWTGDKYFQHWDEQSMYAFLWAILAYNINLLWLFAPILALSALMVIRFDWFPSSVWVPGLGILILIMNGIMTGDWWYQLLLLGIFGIAALVRGEGEAFLAMAKSRKASDMNWKQYLRTGDWLHAIWHFLTALITSLMLT